MLGGAAYLGPPAVCAAGVLIVLRPLLPTVKPLPRRGHLPVAGITLGLAAGSLGLGPGQADHAPLLDRALRERPRGRGRGAALLGRTQRLFSDWSAPTSSSCS